jgi:hypothetical protein
VVPMEIRYTATPDDVGAVLRYNLRHSSRFLLFLASIALYPVALTAIVALISRGHIRVSDVLIGLSIGLLAVIGLPIVMRFRTKRDERVLNVDAQGIRTSVGKRSGDVRWSQIASIDVTEEYVFITGKSANAFAIPARAFTSNADRLEFVRQISAFRQAAHYAPAI